MVDHRQVYRQGADLYQQLISREDYQGNLLPAIQQIIHPEGLDVIDLGSGTGRLACMLAPFARSVFAFDLFPHMLYVAESRLKEQGLDNWLTAASDHRRIPLDTDSVDLVISSWSICYLVVWEGESWKSSLQDGLLEMKRLLRPGGIVIIIETLGTGVEEPQPPAKLQDYFQYLDERGFDRTWIRTDYRFSNQEEARTLVEGFFGPEMLSAVRLAENPILPECTGVWWIGQGRL